MGRKVSALRGVGPDDFPDGRQSERPFRSTSAELTLRVSVGLAVCLAGPGECLGHVFTLFIHSFTPKTINGCSRCAKMRIHSLRLAVQEDSTFERTTGIRL